ncbi:MAG TPA: RND transporter [Chitinophagaceae bacterium]|nr:RND transporter [Chitinophagaceae bacterium]
MKQILKPYSYLLMASILVMLGCTVPKSTQSFKALALPGTYQGSKDTSRLVNMNWQTFFQDTALLDLVEEALQNNFDLQKALQRISMAKAQMNIAANARLPMLEAVASAGFTKYGKYTIDGVGNFDTNLSPNISKEQRIPVITPDLFLGLKSTWELDVWGKLNDRKKAAFAKVLASEKERQWLVTQLVAQVADMYYELIALDSEMEILQKNIYLQEDALSVVRIQKAGGRANELAVQQFEAQLYNTKSFLAVIKQSIVKTENQLNQLLGRLPQPVKRKGSVFNLKTGSAVKTGVPSDLLLNRPDIRAAELKLMAAGAELSASRKSFLPSFNITPYLGFHSFNAAQMITPGSIAYGLMGSMTGPVWNRGRLKGMLKEAEAQRAETWYEYQQTLLKAFQEVTTSMGAVINNEEVYELKKKQALTLESAVVTARELYVTGYASYLEVITAQQGSLESQLQSVLTYKTLLQSQIDLYRSLGGGWQ